MRQQNQTIKAPQLDIPGVVTRHLQLSGTYVCLLAVTRDWVGMQVMALRPRFAAAAQQAQAQNGSAGGYDEDDIEAVKSMARLFAELGESYTALIATGEGASTVQTN